MEEPQFGKKLAERMWKIEGLFADPNQPPGTMSDFVDVFIAGSAIPIYFDLIEGTIEPPIIFGGGPYLYDMMENTAVLTLSDTLDIQQFAFRFESDSTEEGLLPFEVLPTDVFYSFPELGPDGRLIFGYDVTAVSDADIPEPSSLALAFLGLVGLAA